MCPQATAERSNNRQPSTTAMPFVSSSYIINNNFNIVIAELNSRFSNKLSNKLQVGYNQLRDFRSSPGGIFPLVDIENGAGVPLRPLAMNPLPLSINSAPTPGS